MALNATEIKTRHGLILQGVLSHALTSVGITYRENWQYNPKFERPDFVIPSDRTPEYAVEVHQTDVRNSFQMKILRSFNAVSEAKGHFGGGLISVNVLFGDPKAEVPESNLRALLGFFDINFIPRYDVQNLLGLMRLEGDALSLASTENTDVASAISQLVPLHTTAIQDLGEAFKNNLKVGAKEELQPLWAFEANRLDKVGDPPKVGEVTHYKRTVLQSLFISDSHFKELRQTPDFNETSISLKQQVVDTKLGEKISTIRGDVYVLSNGFKQFLKETSSDHLRKLCEDRIAELPEMHWFFEDIRSPERRAKMASIFLKTISEGPVALRQAIEENLEDDNYKGITHRRCWVADLISLYVGVSHNEINRRLVVGNFDVQRIGNPFNQITYKSARFMSDSSTHPTYLMGIIQIYNRLVVEQKEVLASTVESLASRLLALRMDGVVKLQKLNPIYLTIESIAESLGATFHYQSQSSLLSSLARSADAVGKNTLYILRKNGISVQINGLYVGDTYGSDHKADEWSARRRSLDYGLSPQGQVVRKDTISIFIVDGVWAEKSIAKLYNAGWTHIIRLHELEQTLSKIFNPA